MSVDAVHTSSPGIEVQTRPHAVPTPRSADSENNSKVEVAKPRNVPAPLAIPEHEVKVIVDTPENNTLVYQVLDKQSGDLVLQVPSAEQLRRVHESQELLQRIAARGKVATSDETSAPVAKGRENSSGNKL